MSDIGIRFIICVAGGDSPGRTFDSGGISSHQERSNGEHYSSHE